MDPVGWIVSFHLEAGYQYLVFRSRELFPRCNGHDTAQQYRSQEHNEEPRHSPGPFRVPE